MSEIFNETFMTDIGDQIYWNSLDLWTVHELIYLYHGVEPIPYELHEMVIGLFERYYPGRPHSTNHQACIDKFAEMIPVYNKIKNHAKSLPNVATPETFVFWDYKDSRKKIDRFGYEPRFLVNWIGARGYSKPSWINPIESIHHQGRKDKTPRFDDSQMMIDSWFNLDACRAPKLVALIRAYVKEEQHCIKHNKHKFSTGHIASILKNDYEIIGAGNEEDFLKRIIHVASVDPSGGTFKKKVTNK